MVNHEFDGVNLGDERLRKRCLKVAAGIQAKPEKSFPKQTESANDLKGLYRFFANDQVSHRELVRPHINRTVQRCRLEKVVLVVQDTSSLNFAKHPGVTDLGYIDKSERKYGMLFHNVYAVSGDRKPLGLLQQQVFVRKTKVAKNETKPQRLARKRESEKWEKGLLASQQELSPHPKVIQVADREADIYTFIEKIQEVGQGFVIRCAQNRSTLNGTVFTEIGRAEIRGGGQIEIARNGRRKKRTAQVRIQSCTVQIRAPQAVNRKGPALPVNMVIVEEENPPANIEGLCWMLLTSEPIETVEDCWTVIHYYQSRWLIEEFHKGLKTGFNLEERQLQTKTQLEKVLGMFSVLTYHVLLLRYYAKFPSGTPTTSDLGFNKDQIEILKFKFPQPDDNLTPGKLLFLVARLGGFIGRKSDGTPGWITLMRGMYDLLLLEHGFIMAKILMGKG